MYQDYDNDNRYYNQNPYEPSEPPRKKPKRKRSGGKAVLLIMVIVAMVAIVSVVSIEGYKLFEAHRAENGNVVQEPQPSAPAEEPEQPAEQTPEESEPPVSHAQEGISEGYDLEAGSAIGLLEKSPERVAEQVTPSVVCIQNYKSVTYQTQQNNGFFGWYGSGMMSPSKTTTEIVLNSEGSGIILTEDGYIATNAHVVNGADLLKVVLYNDETYEAKLVGIDVDTDLAVIKVDISGLQPADLGDSEELKVGQYVMAIGNPGGMEFSSTVTLGIVSAVDRPLQLEESGYLMNTIQTDAAINPGNSGGALVNMNGQVVGINSAKYVADGYEGLGFAISINEALPIIKDLMDYGSVQGRSMLGINGTMLDSVTARYYQLKEGFYVYSVTNPNAGTLAAGDVITKINDTEIKADSDIKNVIKDLSPGTQITVEYYRSENNSTETTTLTLIEYTEVK